MRLLPLLRLLASSLLVGGALAAPVFAESIDYFTGPESEWLATLDAAPATDQTLSAARTLHSLKLDAGVDISQAGFALSLGSGGLLTTGNADITVSGGPLGTGNTTPLLVQTENTTGTTLGSTLVGTGGLVKTGAGTLTLSGVVANTYTGVTTVNAGTLVLAKSSGITAVPGDLVIGDGQGLDTVRFDADEQIANTATVTLHGGSLIGTANIARLDLNGATGVAESRVETFASLNVSGNGDLDFSDGTVVSPSYLFLDSLVVSPGSRMTVRNWIEFTDFLLVKRSVLDTPGGQEQLSRVFFEGQHGFGKATVYDSNYYQIIPDRSQVITFPAIPDQTDGDAPLVLHATASSGLPVYYEIVSGFVSWNDDGDDFEEASDHWLRLDYPGEVTIRALQDGDAESYDAAAPVERTFTIRPGARPANDDFADAIVLAGEHGTVTGSNRFATAEPEEPDHENDYPPIRSVWWRWTAPAVGYASFDNLGSALQGGISVFEGGDLASLNSMASGENSYEGGSSALLPVVAGTTYFIRLSGFENYTGDLRLRWTFLTTPILKPASRITTQGFTASWSGNARAYRLEIFDDSDEETPRLVLPVANASSRVVRGLASATHYTFRIVATDGAGLDVPSEYKDLETLPSETSAPANDFAYSAVELDPAGGTLDGDNRGATNESFEGTSPLTSLWYRWTPPTPGIWRFKIASSFAATLALYLDIELTDVSPLASAKDGQPLEWETRADTPYLLQVSGQDAAQGAFTLTWELVSPGTLPTNDNFADAAPLAESPGSVTGSNRLADVEENEPYPGIGSLWWSWTAPGEGVVVVSKTSDFDSRLIVFRGAALNQLADVYSSADYYDSPSFETQAGVTYYFRIDGRESAPRGTVGLNLRFLPRPVLAPATAITETGFTVSWTGTDGPGVLRLYDYGQTYGYSPEQTVFVPAGAQTHTFTHLRPGTTYRYDVTTTATVSQISTRESATTLIATGPVPANDAYDHPITLAPGGGALTASNLYASNEGGENDDPDQANAGRASLWYVWTAPSTGEWRFSLADSAVPAGIEIYQNGYLPILSPLAEAQGSPEDGGAQCLIVAQAGQTFRIALLGVGESRGDLALAWDFVRPLSPPANDDFADALELEGASGSVPVTLDLASPESADSYSDRTPNVWFRWLAPTSGRARFTLSSTNPDSSLWIHTGAYLGDLGSVTDDFGEYDFDGSLSCEWNAQAGVVYSIRVEGNRRLGADATLTWSLPPPSAAPLVITRGARFVTLRLPPRDEEDSYRVLVVSTHPDLSEPIHQFYLHEDAGDYVVPGLLPSTRYYYQFHNGQHFQSDASSAAIGIVDTAPDKSASPANDIDHPVKIPASGGSIKGTTKNAPAMSVWYSFTPATSGLWKVRVSAPDHNSYFTVHRASTLADPIPAFTIASAYDTNTGQNFAPAKTVERLAPLRAGVTYLVEVIDYPGESGAFTLSLAFASPLAPPPNDDFADATPITGRSGSVAGDLRLASGQPEELLIPSNPYIYTHRVPERSAWWRWTAPLSGRVRFTLTNRSSPTMLDVFAGNSLTRLYGVAQRIDYDSATNGISVRFEATAGEIYYLRAGSVHPPAEACMLSWSPAPGALYQSIDFPELVAPAAGQMTLLLSASASSGLPTSYRIDSGSATIEGNLLRFTGPGLVRVSANQAGDDFYDQADPSIRYVLSPIPFSAHAQSIHFPWPGDRYVGSAPGHLLASATSGLPVEFEIVSGPATVVGNILTVTAPGKVVVRAKQPGDATIPAAIPVEHTFTVLNPPTIPPIALARVTRVYNGRPHVVTAATLTSGAHATYVYKPAKGLATATPPTDAGTYTVTATLDDPARSKATSTLVIAKAPLTATGTTITRLVGQPNPPLAPITYQGFMNGENAAVLDRPPVATTEASAKSAAGAYPITLSGGADNNYVLTYVPGRLTVLGFGGSYEALLFDSRSVAVGKLELTIPAYALTYTGALTLVSEADPIAIRGSLAATETPLSATGAWSRSTDGTVPLALSFRLAGDTLDGALRLNEEEVLAIPSNSGARLYTPTDKQAPAWAGTHTFLLSDPLVLDENDSRPLPLGSSHATATIASGGGLTLKGRLADGTPLTASAKLDVALRYRLLVKPYAKRLDSFLSGPLLLAPHPDQARFPGRLHAPEDVNLLVWAKTALPDTTKPSAQDKTYREGFAVDALAGLDPWLPPVVAQKATKTSPARPTIPLAQRLDLPTDETGAAPFFIAYDAHVYLGESEYDVPAEAVLALNNRVSTADNPVKWTLTMTPATGAFSGSFVLTDTIPAPTVKNPDATKSVPRKVTFSGVLSQADAPDQAIGYGHFLLPALPDAASTEQASGEIRLLAPAPTP
ncbi:MAG: fibronectin type III domain-containing protein [Burkholderiales bacterium]|nr:fibronectin type III domain-containing protein [Opitutaceae bacterium]